MKIYRHDITGFDGQLLYSFFQPEGTVVFPPEDVMRALDSGCFEDVISEHHVAQPVPVPAANYCPTCGQELHHADE